MIRWEPVRGWPYEVSDHGEVRRSAGACRGARAGRILKPATTPAGHKQVALCCHGIQKNFYIHRLVAEAFIGPRPVDGMVVCHGDGDGGNNHYMNLRWDTQQGNLHDARRHGTSLDGEASPEAKLTEEKVRHIRTGSMRVTDFAKLYEVAAPTICDVQKRRTWKNVA